MPTIELNHITKIEGHASLKVTLKDGKVEDCELSSVEGSRYFEEIMHGRDFTEAFELSSRICGICSSAHTICSIMAIEDALDLTPSPQTFALRELLTLGERIRSHATHLYFMVLPDYLGAESAMALLPAHKDEIRCALRLMQAGNALVKCIGGRDLHPVSAAVGGFQHIPTAEDLRTMIEHLKRVKGDAVETAKLFSSLSYPTFEHPIETISLVHPKEYAMLRGAIRTSSGDFRQQRYDTYFTEYHEARSTANFVAKEGKAYRVGALARIQHNHKLLSPDAKRLLKASPLVFPYQNPFLASVAQAIELVHCIDDAIDTMNNLKPRQEKIRRPEKLKKKRGIAGIEVPRGILWHEYTLDAKGKIVASNIITPTAQNLRAMQEDIRAYLPQVLHLEKAKIELEIEKLIRSYDPCFSCSTHFLDVEWDGKGV